jgi:hypothetical protein
VTSTEVDGNSVAVVKQMLERQDMRAGEIFHMNIVTYGCAIRRWIVRSKHRDIGSPNQSRIKDERNETGLRIVILADLSRGISASGVKITSAAPISLRGAAKVIHHVFANELAEAIRINWIVNHMFGDWRAIRLAINRAA